MSDLVQRLRTMDLLSRNQSEFGGNPHGMYFPPVNDFTGTIYSVAANKIESLQRELEEARQAEMVFVSAAENIRRKALFEAAELAEGSAEGSGELLALASKGKDIVSSLCHSEGLMTAKVIAAQLRARAEETKE